MTLGASAFSKVILEKPYDTDSPDSAINEAVQWAESIRKELENRLEQALPRRR
jgi:hypothetical protein